MPSWWPVWWLVAAGALLLAGLLVALGWDYWCLRRDLRDLYHDVGETLLPQMKEIEGKLTERDQELEYLTGDLVDLKAEIDQLRAAGVPRAGASPPVGYVASVDWQEWQEALAEAADASEVPRVVATAAVPAADLEVATAVMLPRWELDLPTTATPIFSGTPNATVTASTEWVPWVTAEVQP